jgi:hypothetical protein
MANVDRPNGLTFSRYLGGGRNVATNDYTIASAYNTSIFNGDPVKSTGTDRNVAVAAAGDTMVGVFKGCSYTNAAGDIIFSNYWPASTTATDIVAFVIDDPDAVFTIQGDGAIVAADIGATADLVAGTGDTTTGRSAYELNSSDIATGAGVKIMGLVKRPDNAYGANAEVEVLINEHENRSALTAV